MRPFESIAEVGQVIPYSVLAYTLPSGITLTLWYCEGGMWEVREDNGRVVANCLVSWNHAITQWERLVPVRQ